MMHDIFADITNAELRAIHADPTPHFPSRAHDKNPADLFVYGDYDWTGFDVSGQVVIQLTQGYFTFIGEEDVEKLGTIKPYALAEESYWTAWNKRVRACVHHPVRRRPTTLARFLKDAREGEIMDHINNLPLDNRSAKNLWSTSSGANNANRFHERSVNSNLKVGVKKIDGKYIGRIKFDKKEHASERFLTEDEAHEWYVARHTEFYGSGIKPPRSLPIFPLRKDADIKVHL